MVLYELRFKFEFAYIIPVIMLVFILLAPTIVKKTYEKQRSPINLEFVRVFCIGAAIFVIFIGIITYASAAIQYLTLANRYGSGDYQIVEGYVENFKPMHGNSYEAFSIEGVEFSYSDYDLSQPGYRNGKNHGGVIIGNGQRLLIRYVEYNHKNCILYIEQKD